MVWPLLAAYMGASALSSMGKGRGLSQVPIVGGFFNDPAQEKLEDAMRDYGLEAQARAPWVAQQWQNLRGQVEQAYAPTRTALAQIYAGTPVPQDVPAIAAGAAQTVAKPTVGAAYPGAPPPMASQRQIPGASPLPTIRGR